MKKFLNYIKNINKLEIIKIILIIVLIIFVILSIKKYEDLKKDYYIAVSNEMAYINKYMETDGENRVFKYTIEQLNMINDSVINQLKETQKELKIKDKELKDMAYLLSQFNKKDTIHIIDTIFKDVNFYFDTIIGDKWMNTHLEMSYPNNINLSSNALSEKEVFVHTNKETVKPPKKCFIGRWFQKKHTVIKVTIEENNPYIINEENTFIEVIN